MSLFGLFGLYFHRREHKKNMQALLSLAPELRIELFMELFSALNKYQSILNGSEESNRISCVKLIVAETFGYRKGNERDGFRGRNSVNWLLTAILETWAIANYYKILNANSFYLFEKINNDLLSAAELTIFKNEKVGASSILKLELEMFKMISKER